VLYRVSPILGDTLPPFLAIEFYADVLFYSIFGIMLDFEMSIVFYHSSIHPLIHTASGTETYSFNTSIEFTK
jgi:hypothetical protein